jgi:NitT/TauT family transport system substrate-binding protein
MIDREDTASNHSTISRGAVSRRAVLSMAAAASGAAAVGFPRKSVAQQAQLKVGMANSVMTVTYPYITNAQQFGFFEKEGVKVDVVMGQGSPQILSLLVAGTVDLVFCNPEPMIRVHADRALPVKSIFVVIESQYRIAVPEDSPIQQVQDLKGKRLGMFSPQSGIDYLKARLLDVGMSADDLQIVPTGFGGQVIHAVQQKQVDAILYWDDALAMFGFAGLKLRDLPKASWEKGLYQYIATTTQNVIQTKPDALRRALRGMAQGQMLAAVSPEKTIEAFWRQYPDQAPKPDARETAWQQNLVRIRQFNSTNGTIAGATRDQLAKHRWGNQTLQAWSQIQENLVKIGGVSKKVDPSSLFDNQFLDYANGFDRSQLIALADAKN